MVSPPDLDSMIYETDVQERYENRHLHEDVLFKQETSLSELSRARIKAKVVIPEFLTKGSYTAITVKRFSAESPLVNMKIQDQLPYLSKNIYSTYFVEIQNQAMESYLTNIHEDG
jgi:hypothetical protein